MDDLAERLVADLWYYPSRAWTSLEWGHGGDDPINDQLGVVRRIPGHVRPYRLNVLDCLRRPDDSSHRSRRRFASL